MDLERGACIGPSTTLLGLGSIRVLHSKRLYPLPCSLEWALCSYSLKLGYFLNDRIHFFFFRDFLS